MGNSKLDRRSCMLAASALFIFGAFVGCAVYRLLGLGESELYDNLIERYFLALFYRSASMLDVFRVVADCCLHELWAFLLVFIAGFTVYNPIVGGAVLLYRGILFGFALTMLQFSTRTGLLFDSMAYLIASLAISLLLMSLCAHAVMYYYTRWCRARTFFLIFLRVVALVCVNVVFMLFMIYVYI